MAAALRAGEQQALNSYLCNKARKLEALVAKKREKMREPSPVKGRERLQGGYIEQIDALAEDFDFRQQSGAAVAWSGSLRAFVDGMVEMGARRNLPSPRG